MRTSLNGRTCVRTTSECLPPSAAFFSDHEHDETTTDNPFFFFILVLFQAQKGTAPEGASVGTPST